MASRSPAGLFFEVPYMVGQVPTSSVFRALRSKLWLQYGDADKAIADCRKAIDLSATAALGYESCGYAFWITGDFEKSAKFFDSWIRVSRDKTMPLLWSHLARARIVKSSGEEMRTISRDLDLRTWPGSAFRLIVGDSNETWVISTANDRNKTKNDRQVCEARFFVGQLDLIAGHHEAAVSAMREVARTCAARDMTHVFAAAELRRMGETPPVR